METRSSAQAFTTNTNTNTNDFQDSESASAGPEDAAKNTDTAAMNFRHSTRGLGWPLGEPPFVTATPDSLTTMTSTGVDGGKTVYVTIRSSASAASSSVPTATGVAAPAKVAPNAGTSTAAPIVGSVVGVAVLGLFVFLLRRFLLKRQGRGVGSAWLPASRDMSDQLRGDPAELAAEEPVHEKFGLEVRPSSPFMLDGITVTPSTEASQPQPPAAAIAELPGVSTRRPSISEPAPAKLAPRNRTSPRRNHVMSWTAPDWKYDDVVSPEAKDTTVEVWGTMAPSAGPEEPAHAEGEERGKLERLGSKEPLVKRTGDGLKVPKKERLPKKEAPVPEEDAQMRTAEELELKGALNIAEQELEDLKAEFEEAAEEKRRREEERGK